MTTLLANYEEHRAFFRALLADECSSRVLLFKGDGGMGKTTLLTACMAEARQRAKQIHCVPIQLRESAVNVAEIFYRLGDQIGWPHFPQFVEQVAAFQETPTVNIEKNRMLGQNHISVALHAEQPTDRTYRQAALTDACFKDLHMLSKPLLMVLDTYEAATTDVRQWFDGPFLARAARTPLVRVLVAGRETPDPHNIEWGHCCQAQDLFGVHEAQHWLPVVAAMGRFIDVPDPHSWMAGICHALKGRPKDIMQVIENLPRRGVSA